MINNYQYKKKYLKYKIKYLKSKEIKDNIQLGKGNNKDEDKIKPIKAICVFSGEKIKGIVKFTEDLENSNVIIWVKLSGLNPNSQHGFHVHESGDLSDNCESMCAHFNPYNKNHGCPGNSNNSNNSNERHVGDLGNLQTDFEGNVDYTFVDNCISLRGDQTNIIGRGLIIHADPDDCGKGGHELSLKTGNSGKRIGCGIIGYSKENFNH